MKANTNIKVTPQSEHLLKFKKLRKLAVLNEADHTKLCVLNSFTRERNLQLALEARRTLKAMQIRIVWLADEMEMGCSNVHHRLRAAYVWDTNFFDKFVSACEELWPLVYDDE